MNRWSIADSMAPAERLAALRIAVGTFIVAYLVLRLPVFVELASRSSDAFQGVGPFALVGRPLPSLVVLVLVAVAVVGALMFALGWGFRWSAPTFAVALLAITAYRSSWGQLLHFENIFVMHVLVLCWSPASDAWSLDARRGRRALNVEPVDPSAERELRQVDHRYGFPIRLAALITVVTYVIAGVAKVRFGGLAWVDGETLRRHIAYSATRLDLLGGTPAPLASTAIEWGSVLTLGAAASVVIELAAPVALLGGRLRSGWVVAAWSMHVGILATMLVGFPYPLFLIAFAPFFELERLVDRAGLVAGRRLSLGRRSRSAD